MSYTQCQDLVPFLVQSGETCSLPCVVIVAPEKPAQPSNRQVIHLHPAEVSPDGSIHVAAEPPHRVSYDESKES